MVIRRIGRFTTPMGGFMGGVLMLLIAFVQIQSLRLNGHLAASMMMFPVTMVRLLKSSKIPFTKISSGVEE